MGNVGSMQSAHCHLQYGRGNRVSVVRAGTSRIMWALGRENQQTSNQNRPNLLHQDKCGFLGVFKPLGNNPSRKTRGHFPEEFALLKLTWTNQEIFGPHENEALCSLADEFWFGLPQCPRPATNIITILSLCVIPTAHAPTIQKHIPHTHSHHPRRPGLWQQHHSDWPAHGKRVPPTSLSNKKPFSADG